MSINNLLIEQWSCRPSYTDGWQVVGQGENPYILQVPTAEIACHLVALHNQTFKTDTD